MRSIQADAIRRSGWGLRAARQRRILGRVNEARALIGVVVAAMAFATVVVAAARVVPIAA
jgi:hypothetical protein